MQRQTTLATVTQFSGIGLHSGQCVSITMRPAPAGTGIVFVRTDLPNLPEVKACTANVTGTMRATTLENGEAKVFTVEHLLAAFAALRVDNCRIDINSVEPPVADGSALPFVHLIKQAGIVELDALAEITTVNQALAVRHPDKFIAIMPYDGFRITFTSVNPHPMLGVQFGDYELSPEVFETEIAPARTIGFLHEVEALKAQGLALGGSLENAIVYDHEKVLNPLRYDDELVRHKILDIIGDLALVGRVHGHVVAVKSSHALNTELARMISQIGGRE